MSVSASAVSRFVREVLGCTCADEVFECIEVRRGSNAVESCCSDYELRIGGRLLVVVTSEAVESLSATRLERVISEGIRARDDGQFKRFRLVVQEWDAAKSRNKLLRMFEEVVSRDNRTHLHVVGKSEEPHFFLG